VDNKSALADGNTPVEAEIRRYLLKTQKGGYLARGQETTLRIHTVKRRLGNSPHQKPSNKSATTLQIVGGKRSFLAEAEPQLSLSSEIRRPCCRE